MRKSQGKHLATYAYTCGSKHISYRLSLKSIEFVLLPSHPPPIQGTKYSPQPQGHRFSSEAALCLQKGSWELAELLIFSWTMVMPCHAFYQQWIGFKPNVLRVGLQLVGFGVNHRLWETSEGLWSHQNSTCNKTPSREATKSNHIVGYWKKNKTSTLYPHKIGMIINQHVCLDSRKLTPIRWWLNRG